MLQQADGKSLTKWNHLLSAILRATARPKAWRSKSPSGAPGPNSWKAENLPVLSAEPQKRALKARKPPASKVQIAAVQVAWAAATCCVAHTKCEITECDDTKLSLSAIYCTAYRIWWNMHNHQSSKLVDVDACECIMIMHT